MSPDAIYRIGMHELRSGVHTARVGAQEILIIDTAKGLRVFDGRCPHLGGPLLEGHITQRTVVCPWHAYAFDSETGACRTTPGRIWSMCPGKSAAKSPMPIALTKLPHTVVGDTIEVFPPTRAGP